MVTKSIVQETNIFELKNTPSYDLDTLVDYKDGIVYESFPERCKLDEERIQMHNKFHKKLSPEGKIFLLGDLDNVISMDKAAKKYLLKPDVIKDYGAFAFVATKLVPMVIGRMFLSINKPPIPGKIFASHAQAVEWLSELKKE